MLRKLFKSAMDKLAGNKSDHKPAPTTPPPAIQPQKKAAIAKPADSKAQQARPAPAPPAGGYRQPRPRRRKPSSQSRPPASTQGERPKLAPKTPWNPEDFKVEPEEGKTRFHDLNLPQEIMHGINDIGFEYCTPIQSATLPQTLAGADVTGKAQTGTGKTAAFLITILTRLNRTKPAGERRRSTPRALIMVPTRELAMQVQKEAALLGKYCRCEIVAVFGGMDYMRQKQTLAEREIDIIVATPGRLLDFNQHGDVNLSKVEILVIDEADEMLNMGFIPDIRRIVNCTPPKANRQTMLFGATLTPEVARLASQWTRNPLKVEIKPEQVAVDTVDKIVYLVRTKERFTLLYNLITQQDIKRVLVFCNRRDQTRMLADQLSARGINCAALSGDIPQRQRIRTVEDFRSGKIRVMVSTDVAGRGIHIEDISHVVNYNLPVEVEDYVHRIGRTGRAGSTGTSISFATEDESYLIPAIETYLGEKLPCVYPAEALLTPLPPPAAGAASRKPPQSRSFSAPSQPRPRSSQPRRSWNNSRPNSTASATRPGQPPRATPPDTTEPKP